VPGDGKRIWTFQIEIRFNLATSAGVVAVEIAHQDMKIV
jgi:hypothetical protein